MFNLPVSGTKYGDRLINAVFTYIQAQEVAVLIEHRCSQTIYIYMFFAAPCLVRTSYSPIIKIWTFPTRIYLDWGLFSICESYSVIANSMEYSPLMTLIVAHLINKFLFFYGSHH
jgi:hypothetical protein